ncbi:arylsulfatase D isoform X2 [Corythoichthys intestinalis]|uniref:arylsulfatase D isoform X2 n=1 Tax=Corythoichthys intestinalis TaxID=161448 RepID=UPI0025A53A51|nr:arylsulfatase D isoform X2 [Corythoichthys intestinalis]
MRLFPMRLSLLAPVLLLLSRANVIPAEVSIRKPNIVLVMADDLGIGDVCCYGNNTIRTPNIDRLASEGVKLTQHITAAPLCTPSRAAFMTGRYAVRSGMAGSGAVQVNLFLAGSGGLPPNETTFAKRLLQQGYTTGLVGKWHLGLNCERRGDHCHHPNQHGFTFFYGLPFTLFNSCIPGLETDILSWLQNALEKLSLLLAVGLFTLVCVRAGGLVEISARLLVALFLLGVIAVAVWYIPFGFLPWWNCIIMRDQEVVEQPITMETLPHRLLTEAQRFIQRSRHGCYGDDVEEMDWIVGELTKTVDSLGLTNDTLIYFTSDHGGHLEDSLPLIGQRGGWNGIYRGGKSMGGWEGGIRVPGIFRWPGRLPAGRVVDEPTSLMDIYPTLKHLAGDFQLDRHLDGHNLMPLLEGKVYRSEHEFMFHYCGSHLHAARWHPPDSDSIFKVHFVTPNFFPLGAVGCYDTHICLCHGDHVTRHDPPLLFDLSRDPSESRPLSPDTELRYGEVLHRVAEAVEVHQRSLTDERPNQLTMEKILWRPWLQPCCGTFPFCACKEDSRTTGWSSDCPGTQ